MYDSLNGFSMNFHMKCSQHVLSEEIENEVFHYSNLSYPYIEFKLKLFKCASTTEKNLKRKSDKLFRTLGTVNILYIKAYLSL